MSPTKEELQKQLDIIVKREEKEMIEAYYPEFKKNEGKCFKYRAENTNYYTKVTKIKPSDVYNTHGNGVACRYTGWSFHTDKRGNISIHEENSYIHCLGKAISNKEFDAAFNKLIDKLNELR
jgi:hypothetical protein